MLSHIKVSENLPSNASSYKQDVVEYLKSGQKFELKNNKKHLLKLNDGRKFTAVFISDNGKFNVSRELELEDGEVVSCCQQIKDFWAESRMQSTVNTPVVLQCFDEKYSVFDTSKSINDLENKNSQLRFLLGWWANNIHPTALNMGVHASDALSAFTQGVTEAFNRFNEQLNHPITNYGAVSRRNGNI